MCERADADEISAALDAFLSKASPPNDWWTRFAFHYTDVRNAASIIKTKTLVCRRRAVDDGLMVNDNADQTVIDHSEQSHQWVRLYFRPMTPTQYRNEGFQPAICRTSGHCPVPIFFLFDLECVLRTQGSRFAPGGMNKRIQMPPVYQSPSALATEMPARDIYSYGSYDPNTHGHLKDRRHAEILLRDELRLEKCLKGIICRSPAERETLLYLLSAQDRARFEALVRLDTKGDIFERRWPFVERVDVSRVHYSTPPKPGTQVLFRFWPEAPSGIQKIEYEYEAWIKDLGSGKSTRFAGTYDHRESKMFALVAEGAIDRVKIVLQLDGDLAYVSTRSVKSLF